MSRSAVIKERFGVDLLNSVLEAMKPQNRDSLSSVIASSWYDEDIYKDFNQSIKKVLSPKDPQILEHLGAMSAEAGLKGVYSSKLKEGDVLSTLARCSSLWKMFHDTGELEVNVVEGENRAVFTVKGYGMPHVESCINLLGWGKRMVELAGGSNVRVTKKKCECKGDEYCEMVAEWD